MTGPEHYKEAERLLAQAARWELETVVDDDPGPYLAIDSARSAAQAHAILASAAGRIDMVRPARNQDIAVIKKWWEVTGS